MDYIQLPKMSVNNRFLDRAMGIKDPIARTKRVGSDKFKTQARIYIHLLLG